MTLAKMTYKIWLMSASFTVHQSKWPMLHMRNILANTASECLMDICAIFGLF